ncbi:TPA: hypothetical protein DDW35_05235, partial [Candidatus Sumerlaeota bacterium]|nr:hypothetical protein [Candidatus Sumerlaeota bacterium]
MRLISPIGLIFMRFLDDIQLVDCFERLHQHLLRQEPALQKRGEALPPFAYRLQPLAYFLTHLVGLLTELDDQTAEGQRRIRKFLLELDDRRPSEFLQERLMVREKGGVLQKPLGAVQKEKLRESICALKDLEDAHGCSDKPFGVIFDAVLKRLEHLPGRVEWLCKTLPCLSLLNAMRFLSRIGYPVVVPDTPCQTFLFRLGFIERMGAASVIQYQVCAVGAELARTLQRSEVEINLWIRAFTGGLRDLAPATALCGRKPLCERCGLTSYCQYYRFRRPAASNTEAPLPIKQWRTSDRPRERLEELGAHALEDSELLAIMLRTGSGKMHVLDLARKLLEKFGSLQGIEDASMEELQKVHGIGRMKAIELRATFELGRRLALKPIKAGDVIESSDDVYFGYRGRFQRVKHEEFLLLMLNNKNKVIREELVSTGGLDASIVQPRE